MKTTKRKRLIKKLDKAIMEYVRKRDKMTCQWCGKKVEKSNAHCSHVIPRSRGNALRWDTQNVKLLCFHCHIFKFHKNPIEAAQWFKTKFPKRYKYLEAHKNDIVKYTIDDLKNKLKELT